MEGEAEYMMDMEGQAAEAERAATEAEYAEALQRETPKPTTNELLCAEIANLRTALRCAKAALEIGLLAAKHCRDEQPGILNQLDVHTIELAIYKAELLLK